MAQKSVLMCCYYFPPFARSGGMRSLQFGRRLVERGWDVEILAADPSLYASAVDPASTAKGYESMPWAKVTHVGLPAGRRGHPHSRKREFLATLRDPWRLEGETMRLWVDAVVDAARPILKRRPETVLYIGMQPYAVALAGLRLQRELGTKWVADLADPWTLDEVSGYSSYVHFVRQESAFRKVLRNASSVLANTPDAAVAMAAFEPSVTPRMSIVNYGYDAANIPAITPRTRDDGPFVLLHLGAIEVTGAASKRRNPLRYRPYATDIAGRGTHYLLNALEILRGRRRELFDRLRLRVVSSRTDNEFAAVRDRGMAEQFEWTGMLANKQAMAEVANAHAALLLQQGAPAGHRLRTVRAKSYEYMAIGRPVLGCVPGGDGADFIRRFGRGLAVNPCNAEEIAAGIERLHDDYDSIANAPLDHAFVQQFEWGALTAKLDEAMTKLLP